MRIALVGVGKAGIALPVRWFLAGHWKMNRFSQTFINEGMRAGIPNQNTRKKTITLYIDKGAFRQALDLPHEETIYVLVVDQQGNVLWRTEGVYSQEKGEALTKAIQEYSTLNKLVGS